MPYLGNQPDSNFTTTTVDTFNGNNSDTQFPLSRSATTNDLEVFVENVQQQPTTAYSVSGTTITFTSAPPTGTGNIYVIHRGAAITSPTPPTNSITNAMMQDDAIGLAELSATGTPSSSSYLRGDNTWATLSTTFEGLTDTTVSTSDPTISSNPSATGHIWVNKTSGEVYVCTDATAGANVWTNVGEGTGNVTPTYSVEYVVVGGGGGGGYSYGGGGGAGGYRNSYASETSGRNSSTETPLTVTIGTTYTVEVGGGGAGTSSGTTQASPGYESYISGSGITTVTSTGGGFGGNSGATYGPGGDGGSGGGGGTGSADSPAGGAGQLGQGFDGGDTTADGGASGGGGASAAGVNHNSNDNGRAGGDGLTTNIQGTGSPLTLAGGGGGGGYYNAGAGGSGGGGNAGSISPSVSASNGDTNTGGGGGGAPSGTGGTGGSGVVILRMPTAKYSGTTTGSPTVTTDGTDTILKFTQSGSYTA